MADAALNVKIGADTSEAVANIKKFELTLKDAHNLLKELKSERLGIVDTNELLNSNRAISNVTETIKKLERAGTDGFDNIGNAIAKTQNPLSEAYSGIRKLANILPGIGIGSLIAIGFEALSSALSDLLPNLLGADKAGELLNKTLADGQGKVQGEVSALKDLVAIATDEKNSRELRLKAFKELQDQYPNAFKNMDLEKTSLKELTTITDKLTDALIRQAQIKGVEDEISKISGEIADLLASSQEEIVKTAGLGGILKAILTGNSPASIFLDQLGDAQTKIVKLQAALKSLITTSLTNGDKELLGPAPKPTKIKIEVEPEFTPKAEPVDIKDFLNVDNFDPAKAIAPIQKKLSKFGGIKLDVIAGFNQQEVKDLDFKAQQVANGLNKIFANAGKEGAIGLASTIGSAIGSGANILNAAFEGLLSFLGEGVEAIGKQLIVIGSIATVAATAIKNLLKSPELAIAAGVLFVVAGSALKASASKIHAFADGGIVTGPTNALIGEAGPEVVFPLEQLNRFVRSATGASNRNVNVTGEISGNNLKLVLARTNKNQGFAS